MTIDIAPSETERVASVCDTLGYHHAAATLRALSAALTKAEHLLKMQEIATEMAIVAWDQTVNDLSARPDATNTRVVTVDQLNRWRVYIDDTEIAYNEIRAIIGEVKP